jgi:hypothetical protein
MSKTGTFYVFITCARPTRAFPGRALREHKKSPGPFLFLYPFIPLLEGVAEAALYCARRTSTVSPCAFREQEGYLAAPSSFFREHTLREQERLTGTLPSYA